VARIALVTAAEALPLDEDMPPLVAALRERGAHVATPCWDDASVDWAGFDLALLRSTWDYVDRIDEFLAWAESCASATMLLNPPEVIAWNTDKHYLVALGAAGIDVVPTRFVEPGSDAAEALEQFLRQGLHALTVGAAAPFDEFVIKPAIGAGSRDAARYRRSDHAAALAHLARLVNREQRSAMLQPYLDRVDDAGETALVYLDGRASHAIRKGPLLRLGSGLVDGLFAPEQITAREPDPAEQRLAAAAYAAIPFAAPLYARIDMIRDAQGTPVLLELELTEPSLFLAHCPGSAQRLAQALLVRVEQRAAMPQADAG
jgi:glutathione synthase/RimK-type ligase-like ATP-grasp enzyme